MIKKIQNFIIELQNSEESVKKRWRIILSGISMVIVIGLWALYFNLTFPRIETVAAVQTQSSSGTIRQSLQNIKDTLQNGLRAIKDKSQKTFIINGNE